MKPTLNELLNKYAIRSEVIMSPKIKRLADLSREEQNKGISDYYFSAMIIGEVLYGRGREYRFIQEIEFGSKKLPHQIVSVDFIYDQLFGSEEILIFKIL